MEDAGGRVGVVAQQAKLQLAVPVSHILIPVRFLAAWILIQIPVTAPGKVAGGCTNTLTPAILEMRETQMKLLTSGFSLGLNLSQPLGNEPEMEDLFISSLSVILSFKQIK